ncbi:MAG: sulfur carrier protein ThiS [Puniceicoccales bacterium]|jgi:sulfur carrier protein|nr:sulfur carrier protein ThiS [Puniceicoccales bacterium]
MQIFVNNEPREISQAITLEQFMNTLGLRTFNGIAVALDETVVPRSEWASRQLPAGSHLILIQATQGG